MLGFNHYDFLREIVSKVPDMGGSDGGSAESRSTQRRFNIFSWSNMTIKSISCVVRFQCFLLNLGEQSRRKKMKNS